MAIDQAVNQVADAQPIPVPVSHQFDDAEQQHDASTLGMWVFLATEVMLFGGLLLGYTIYRATYPKTFGEASRLLVTPLATLNTAVLLCSSLVMALAVRAAELGRRTALLRYLLVTLVLGIVFLGIKGFEYYLDYRSQLMPLFGLPFKYPGTAPAQGRLFFNLYFIMTGLHAFHLTIGVFVVGLMTFVVWRKGQVYPITLEIVGLYWHFVDIVWVFVFPLLYLVSLHP